MLFRLKATILGTMAALALAGCGSSVPTSSYYQSRAIDQDIAATHVFGPTTTSPTALMPGLREQMGEAP